MSTTEQERCRYLGGIVCMYSKKEVKCMPLLFALPVAASALELFVAGVVEGVMVAVPAAEAVRALSD